MASPASAAWSDRLRSVDDLYQRQAFADCIRETRDLLREPLLPCLYTIQCHTMLGNAIPDWLERNRHKDIATQLWNTFEPYWPDQLSSEACIIWQSLWELTAFLSRHDPSRAEQRCSDPTVRQSIEHDFTLFPGSSQSPSPAPRGGEEEDDDVKYDTAYLDKEHELQSSSSMEHQKSEAPTNVDVTQPSPPESPSRKPTSTIHCRPSTPPCVFDLSPAHEHHSPDRPSPASPSAPGAPPTAFLKSPVWSRTPSPLF